MAIFSKCEVTAGPHGQQVVATAPVDPGTALVVDEEVIFAVECQHMQSRCALCCCTCEEEVTGVACKACDARCARDPSLQRWADAAQLLGPAQGSVALCAAALAAGTIDFSKLVQDSRELDSRTLQIFQLVAGNLGRITKRTEEDCFACIQAARLNAHALVDHAAGSTPGLDRFDDLTGVQLGQLLSEPLSRFDHACDANAYLSVDIRPGLISTLKYAFASQAWSKRDSGSEMSWPSCTPVKSSKRSNPATGPAAWSTRAWAFNLQAWMHAKQSSSVRFVMRAKLPATNWKICNVRASSSLES